MKAYRYVRLARIFLDASLSAQMEYRANFLINLLGSILLAGGSLFGLTVLFGDGRPIGDWSQREAIVVVGLFTFVQGFIGAMLQPNLNKIAETVRLGTMDFTLMKPVDSQFFVSTRNVNPFHLSDLLLGAAIVIWASAGIPGVTLFGMVLGGLLLLAALAIVYAIWFILSTTAFWFVKVENVTEMFNGLFRAAQFPISAFAGWARLLFTFVVPIAFITTVPAEAIVGRIKASSAIGALLLAAILLLVARRFWSLAVRSYTSASS